MNHEEIIELVNAALDEKNLNFEAKMAETFAMVDGVYVPTGKFTPVRTDKQGKDMRVEIAKGVWVDVNEIEL